MKPLSEIPGDVRFFRAFARFEYALKRTGYRKDSKRVEPDWDKFGREEGSIQGLFEDACGDSDTKYLIDKPPQHELY